MAFLLAFQGLNASLSEQDKQNLKEVAKQLYTQPQAWKSHIEKRLLEIINDNCELNQFYQFYKTQLDKIEEIPNNLLPTEADINTLIGFDEASILKGFKPKSKPGDYAVQINNIAVIVCGSDQPERTVEQVTFLNKWKQFLSNSNPSN